MPSERTQRHIDRLLDEADIAMAQRDWGLVRQHVQDVLDLDPDNADARDFLAAMERKREAVGSEQSAVDPTASPSAGAAVPSPLPRGEGQGEGTPEDQTHPNALVAAGVLPTSFDSGRYTVKKFLGEGGKKKVYLAHDKMLDRDVAFALIKTEGLDDVGRERVSREAQAMGRLGSHPHIVTVFDLGEEAGQPFMVTELMGGGDFGLAVAIDRTRLTQAGMMVGTVGYMPPEQATGGVVTPRSDLYSLGAMLYEMVAGRPPFIGDEAVAIIGQHLNVAPVSPTWHRPDCPPGLEALILRLLEKDPSKRPASAGEVRQALESIAGTIRRTATQGGVGVSLSLTGEGGGEGETRAPDGAQAALANPLYRRAFVGRETELRQLQAAFDAALSGRGSLAMVVGEPGIGKTSVCEQLSTYVALRGGKTLVGHCYEEGSLSLPYLPFVEAMRSYVLAREPEGLRADLGSGAADVARIVSEVRDRLPNLQAGRGFPSPLEGEGRVRGDARGDLYPQTTPSDPSHTAGPDEQRWRLLQAVTAFLRSASLVEPLLLILEDLHDADRGTIDLLVHLARNLDGARLLSAGTYRDVEVDRSHPLSSALAELRRGQNFLRVPLRGLTAEEVQRMMAAVAQREVPWPFAELVHRQTEGNPLFVQEMLRYLVEEGLVAEQEGTLRRVGDDTLAGRIPEGLRDVIGKRLSRLADKTNQVLSVASVVGREFRLDVLQRVANLGAANVGEEAVEAALEEAASIAVVEQRTGVGGQLSFRFAHAFFRQTLYEELFAARRIRLHQQVARALEAVYGRRVEEHAAELAEHYANSSDPEDLHKAVAYGEMAARRALAVFAYGEAARHYEDALKAQEVLDPDDAAKRCDLLLALGEALLPAGESQRAYESVAPLALALAEALADERRASRACQLACTGLRNYGNNTMSRTALYRQWAERADRYAAAGTAARLYADLALGQLRVVQGHATEALALYKAALAQVRQLDDAEALFQAADALINWSAYAAPPALLEREAGLQLAAEFCNRARAGVQARTVAAVLADSSVVYADAGDRDRAEESWRQLGELAERTRDANSLLHSHAHEVDRAMLDGDLEGAAAGAARLPSYGDELGAAVGGRQQAITSGFRPLQYLNRLEEALAAVPEMAALAGTAADQELTTGLATRARMALGLASLGRSAEAGVLLAQALAQTRAGGDDWQARTGMTVVLLEAAVLLRDREAAGRLATELGPAASSAWCGAAQTCAARHLGAASALLGDREQAMRYYEQALEVCGRLRFRPELALTHLGIAKLLLDEGEEGGASPVVHETGISLSLAGEGEGVPGSVGAGHAVATSRAEALHHLDIAIAELRDMKMQPALERALRHKDMLNA